MTAIRKANPADIPTIIEMARDMHAESPRYHTLGFVVEKINTLALHLISTPGAGGVLVAEKQGKLVGMFAFHINQHFFSNDIFASDIVMYLRPGVRGGSLFPRMVKAFEAWADEYGVKEKLLGVSTGIDSWRTVAALERMGYTPVGIGTMKRT